MRPELKKRSEVRCRAHPRNNTGNRHQQLTNTLLDLARQSGDLQKALLYGEKALEAAQRTKEPRYLLNAFQALIWAYASVRNFDKASEFLAKAFEVVEQLPLNTNLRASWEGILNDELGREFMRKREYLKAADAYSTAIHWYRTWISRLKPNSPAVQRPVPISWQSKPAGRRLSSEAAN